MYRIIAAHTGIGKPESGRSRAGAGYPVSNINNGKPVPAQFRADSGLPEYFPYGKPESGRNRAGAGYPVSNINNGKPVPARFRAATGMPE